MKKLLSIILLITAIIFTSCKEDVAIRVQKNAEKKVQQLSYSFNSDNEGESSVKSGNVSDSTSSIGIKVLSTETWEEGGFLFTANLLDDNEVIGTKANPTQEVGASGVYTFYAYKDVEIKEQSITSGNKIFEVPTDAGTKYGIIFFSTVEDGGVPVAGNLTKDLANKEMIYEAKSNENLGYKVFDKGTMPSSNIIDEIIFTPVFAQLGLSVPRDLVGSIVTVNEVKLLGGAQEKATVRIKYNSEATSNIKVTYAQTNTDYEANLEPEISGDYTILKGDYHNFIPNGNESRMYLKMTTDAGKMMDKEFNMKDKKGNSIIFKQGRRYKLSIDNQTLVSIAIEPSEATLIKGKDTKLKLIATYSGGAKTDVTERAEWVSSKPAVATVSMVADTKGLVKAVEVGESTITAKFAGKEITAKVKVTNDVTEIRVTPNPAEVAKGKTIPLTATALYQDGTDKDVTKDANVNWESVAPGIASVEAKTGIVKGESKGSTKVRATYSGKTGEATVNVTAPVVDEITLSPNPLSIVKGKTGTLTATVKMSDGSTPPTTGYTWSFSPTGVVTGSSTGNTISLTGAKVGSTTATVTCGSKSATATVKVTAAVVDEITLSPNPLSIVKGKTGTLTATVKMSDGSTPPTTGYTWSFSPTGVVTGSSTGNTISLTGAKVGSTTATVTCGSKSATATVKVTAAVVDEITLSPNPLSIDKGRTGTLTATVKMSDGSTPPTTGYTWSFSPTGVVTGSSTGNTISLTGAKVGSTTATVTFGSKSATATVNVTAAVVDEITLSPNPLSIVKGKTGTLTATVKMSDGSTPPTTGYTWSFSPTGVVTGSSTGNTISLTGAKVGSTTATVTCGSKSATATVKVTAAVVDEITLSPNPLSIDKGRTGILTATVKMSDGSTPPTTGYTWSFSPTGVVTGSSTGRTISLTGAKVGSTTATVTFGGKSATATVNVTVAVESISISPNPLSIVKGRTGTLTATVKMSDGSTPPTTGYTWSFSPTGVVTGSSTGTTISLKGAGVGSTTATVTCGGKSATATVNVTAAVVDKITIHPNPLSIEVGSIKTLTATVEMSDGSTPSTRGYTWSFSPTGIVEGRSTSDAIRLIGLSPGSTTVTVTYLDKSATATVKVPGSVLDEITLSPNPLSIVKGRTGTLTATVKMSDGSTPPTTGYTWSFSPKGVVTVTGSSTGTTISLIGAGVGSTTATVTCGSKSATATVNVTAAVVDKITISPNPLSIVKGRTGTLTATVEMSDGSKPTTGFTWSFNPTGVVTGSSTGNTISLTGAKEGTTAVTVTYLGKSATATVKVTAAVVDKITIFPDPLSIPKGRTYLLTARVEMSDGSTPPTTGYTWSFSPTGVVEVRGSSTGENISLKGAGVGSTTATVTCGGKSATATVKVTAAVVDNITISPNPLGIVKGKTGTLTATVKMSDGSTPPTTGYTWSFSPTGVVTGSSTGRTISLTGAKVGSTTATVTCGSKSATATVNVTAAVVDEITLSPNPLSIVKGKTGTLTATVKMSDGSTPPTTGYTWSFSPTGVVTGSSTGNTISLTGAKEGTTTATVTYLGKSATATVKVTAAVPKSIVLTASRTTIPKGGRTDLTAVVTYTDGTKKTSDMALIQAGLRFISDNSSVIEEPFLVAKGKAEGSANITATMGGVTSNSVKITVTAAVPESMDLTANPTTIAIGEKAHITKLVITYSDETKQEITFENILSIQRISNLRITFHSSDESVIGKPEVDMGVVKYTARGKAQGSANITAKLEGVTSNEVKITVTADVAVPESITLSADPTTIYVGGTSKLSTRFHYSDGFYVDNPSGVNFKPSGGISVSGRIVTGTYAGTAGVYAYYGNTSSDGVTITVEKSGGGGGGYSIYIGPTGVGVTNQDEEEGRTVKEYTLTTNYTGSKTWSVSLPDITAAGNGLRINLSVTGNTLKATVITFPNPWPSSAWAGTFTVYLKSGTGTTIATKEMKIAIGMTI